MWYVKAMKQHHITGKIQRYLFGPYPTREKAKELTTKQDIPLHELYEVPTHYLDKAYTFLKGKRQL